MKERDLIKLAVDFSAGSITAAAIKRMYGEGVFTTVAALAAGGIAGLATDKLIDVVDDHTGVVTAAGSVLAEGVGLVGGFFDGLF